MGGSCLHSRPPARYLRQCQLAAQSGPAEPHSVGTLALTKKFRSGILALISMSRGERVDAPIFAGTGWVHSGHRPMW